MGAKCCTAGAVGARRERMMESLTIEEDVHIKVEIDVPFNAEKGESGVPLKLLEQQGVLGGQTLISAEQLKAAVAAKYGNEEKEKGAAVPCLPPSEEKKAEAAIAPASEKKIEAAAPGEKLEQDGKPLWMMEVEEEKLNKLRQVIALGEATAAEGEASECESSACASVHGQTDGTKSSRPKGKARGKARSQKAAPPKPEEAKAVEADSRRDISGTILNHVLRIQISSARNLRNADLSPGLSDPYCVFQIPGKPSSKFKTQVINDSLDPFWGRKADLDGFTYGDSLQFSVYDKDFITADDAIGHVVLSREAIMPAGWSGELVLKSKLNDPKSEDVGKIDVNVKLVRAYCSHSAVKPTIKEVTGAEEEADRREVTVTIYSGHNLKNADWGPGMGKSDPYCVVEVPGKPDMTLKTQVVSNSLDPKWDWTGTFSDFCIGDPLIFTVWDKDTFKHDDFLGRATLEGDQLFLGGYYGDLRMVHGGSIKVKVQVGEAAGNKEQAKGSEGEGSTQKAKEPGGAKKETASKPETAKKGKASEPPDAKKEKAHPSDAAKKEKASAPGNAKKDKAAEPGDAKKGKAAEPGDAKKGKAAEPGDAKKEKAAEPGDAKKARAVEPADAKKEKASEADAKARAEAVKSRISSYSLTKAEKEPDSPSSAQIMLDAAGKADFKSVKKLITAGVSVETATPEGFTVLHMCVMKCHEETVVHLLQHKSKKKLLAMRTADSKDTALHMAARDDQKAICAMLVREGASVKLKNGAGKLPYQLAQGDLAKWLKSEDPTSKPPPWEK